VTVSAPKAEKRCRENDPVYSTKKLPFEERVNA
jgi:hypothetical protein